MFVRKIFYMWRVNRNQWKSREKIEQLQFKKFKKIIHHAYNNVRFYKDKFNKAGVKPEDIKSRKDILKIPTTTKREVVNNFPDNMLARGYQLCKSRIQTTSGSSGIKLKIALDFKAKDFCDCVYGRALFAIGYKPWQSMAYFWPDVYHKKEFHEYIRLMKKNWITSHMKPEDQLDKLLKLKPRIIYSFPSILISLAKIIESKRSKYDSINPEFIISHAELLTEEARSYIESVFKCPVYNEYGAQEFGFRMAWECKKRQGLHIDADSVLIEFLKDGNPVKPGKPGEMVITGLVNRAMPLIRYKIGDIGVYTDRECECGRGLPLLEYIEGRKDDFIVLPSGKIISPRSIDRFIDRFKAVREFRIVQPSVDEISVYIVESATYKMTSDDKARLQNDLLDIFEEQIKIKVEKVSEISRTKRGKRRTVISKVKL